MLTPSFELEQSETSVTIRMRCPYIKAQDVEIVVDGTEFRFYCHPYFLRLHFPGALVENGKEKSSYDIDSGMMTLILPKETPGEYFPNLDMLSTLLDKKVSVNSQNAPMVESTASEAPTRPLIQEIESVSPVTSNQLQLSLQSPNENDEEEFDWSFPQQLPAPVSLTGSKYGFNNHYFGHGPAISAIALGTGLLDVGELDTSTPESRRAVRIALENDKFDEEHYMFDYVNDTDVKRVLEFKPTSRKALKRIQSAGEDTSVSQDEYLVFSEDEKRIMVQLGNREYLLDPITEKSIYLGLVDLVFSWCFDHRVFEGEPSVESYWNIVKLSGTLCCFESFATLDEVLTCSFRRSLAFPLYRHLELAKKVLEDVTILFKLGRRAILKTLLAIKDTLNREETTHVLSRIWINDYCIWIQKASDKTIRSLASKLNHVNVTEEMIGWPLQELHKLAKEIQDEEGDSQMREE